jgi:hypothetical protein
MRASQCVKWRDVQYRAKNIRKSTESRHLLTQIWRDRRFYGATRQNMAQLNG